MYVYIYTYIYIYRSLGVVSDKIAQLSATPYKREILLLLLLLLLRRRLLLLILLLLLLLIIIVGDARGRVKVVANSGNRDRVRPSVARGARRVVRRRPWSVAHDRWYRA